MIKLRFSPETWAKLKARAKIMGVSVAALIVYLVTQAIKHGL